MKQQLTVKEFILAFDGGYSLVKELQEDINALNVYPVPDGDTGINMSLTLESVINELKRLDDADFSEVGHALIKSSLSGARGNSGVILSQILKGFGRVLQTADGKRLQLSDFLLALEEGKKTAYHAVIKPVEGTILTVIRRVSEHIEKKSYVSFEEALKEIVDVAWETVLQTPDMLEVLKKADVIDAGGYGLYLFFEGFRASVSGETPKPHRVTQRVSETFVTEAGYGTYKFCTEAYLKSENLDFDYAKDFLSKEGDSIVLGREGGLWHFHVHTNEPFVVLQEMGKFGELIQVKIDNMAAQVEGRFQLEEKPFAVVVVAPSPKWAELFRSMKVDFVVAGGQTMNPSVGQILDGVKHVHSNKVYVLPNNPNIILSAQQVKELTDKEVIVIPTKNPAQAAVGLSLYFGVEDPLEVFFQHILDETSYLEMTKATKDSRVNGLNAKVGDWLILMNDELKAACSDWDCVLRTLESLTSDAGYTIASIFKGVDAKEDEAKTMADLFSNLGMEVEEYEMDQPFYPYWILVEKS
jgi:DAK2 domain fusion protein YloV